MNLFISSSNISFRRIVFYTHIWMKLEISFSILFLFFLYYVAFGFFIYFPLWSNLLEVKSFNIILNTSSYITYIFDLLSKILFRDRIFCFFLVLYIFWCISVLLSVHVFQFVYLSLARLSVRVFQFVFLYHLYVYFSSPICPSYHLLSVWYFGCMSVNTSVCTVFTFPFYNNNFL